MMQKYQALNVKYLYSMPDIFANYDAKISGIEYKYFTANDYNKFTSQTTDAKIK